MAAATSASATTICTWRRRSSWLLLLLLLIFVCMAGLLRPFSCSGVFFPGFFLKKNNIPQQVHVSLAGPNHIKVSWVTSLSALSTVMYGKKPDAYNFVAEGNSVSYSFLLYKSGYIHNAILGPLEGDTLYYYQCGGVASEYNFKTPPDAGQQVPVTFAIVGDLGQTKWTSSTLSHIQQSEYDLLLLPGDLSYADFYQPLWDSFGRLIEPLASSRPWMVTTGNHDVEGIPLVSQSFKAYNARWQMPYAESGSDSNLYYSFEVASVHVLMLGSYTDCNLDSNQYRWLQGDLANVNRKKTPWVIAVLHAPWYNSNAIHRGDGDDMMGAFEQLLKEAKVDIIFAGHVHAYERTARVSQRKQDPCGIIHITVGSGGNREGLARRFLNPKPSWSLYREASFGHGLLQIMNGTHAHWTWHRNQDDEVVVADEMWFNSFSDQSHSCSASTKRKNNYP